MAAAFPVPKSNGSGELELSVDESNKLRAMLGLQPLRSSKSQVSSEQPLAGATVPKSSGSGNDISMNVNDSNALRL